MNTPWMPRISWFSVLWFQSFALCAQRCIRCCPVTLPCCVFDGLAAPTWESFRGVLWRVMGVCVCAVTHPQVEHTVVKTVDRTVEVPVAHEVVREVPVERVIVQTVPKIVEVPVEIPVVSERVKEVVKEIGRAHV